MLEANSFSLMTVEECTLFPSGTKDGKKCGLGIYRLRYFTMITYLLGHSGGLELLVSML